MLPRLLRSTTLARLASISLGLSIAGGCSPAQIESGTTTAPTATASTPDVPLVHTSAGCVPGRGTDYPVGPDEKYQALADVPWEKLEGGDTVRIHHRPEPYHEKIHVGGVGTAERPIRVCGVKGANGELPVIDGQGATTRKSMVFAYDGHQPRGLIIVGWRRTEAWTRHPEHIIIEGLEIRNGAPPHEFTDKAGQRQKFSENAAGIYVQRGSHITLRQNVVHGNGNGLFVGGGGGEELTTDVLIEGNYIHGNGSPDNYFQHNVYNEASNVTYQYNRFGPPRSGPQGVMGANIKERSAGVVLRYNFVEDGAHLIDLVDAQEARAATLEMPTFRESWVYGNVLVRGAKPSGSMIDYGGDSGLLDTYRKGTLHFFHNTVVVENASHPEYQGTVIFELSTNDEKLDSRNNVYYSDPPRPDTTPIVLLGARDQLVSGVATMSADWVREGIAQFDGIPGKTPRIVATLAGIDGCTRGTSPGFVAPDKRDYRLGPSSPLKGKAAALPFGPERSVSMQYVMHGSSEPRPADGSLTPGAYAAP